jgi:hypothetical protein
MVSGQFGAAAHLVLAAGVEESTEVGKWVKLR